MNEKNTKKLEKMQDTSEKIGAAACIAAGIASLLLSILNKDKN